MFGRAERLTDKRIFTRLFQRGRWIKGQDFSLRVMPTRSEPGQIAFVMSKKVAKSAAIRNRTKRRLRAGFRHFLSDASFTSLLGHNYILIVVHRALDDKPSAEVLHDVAATLQKLRQVAP